MPRPRPVGLALAAVLLPVLGGCGGGDPEPSSPADRELATAASAVTDAVQAFRAEHETFPRRLRQSGSRLVLRRGPLVTRAVDNGIWGSVDLAWYADVRDDRETRSGADPGLGSGRSFAFCLERGGRHATVTGGDDGTTYQRLVAGACLTPPRG